MRSGSHPQLRRRPLAAHVHGGTRRRPCCFASPASLRTVLTAANGQAGRLGQVVRE